MDKVAHQSLRWDLEQDLSHLVEDEHLVRQVLTWSCASRPEQAAEPFAGSASTETSRRSGAAGA
ncbi:hypothetical protein ID032_33500 [Pseudomonas aeruginosa]|uniref:hypothetical protein n=1 Tax=Pseudomonas aeruginosa TaxID=287 RepID=UPI001ADC125F|nr:hypothetical protein [Pseudomonas aeruginosa]MBO8350615.1 hypothetical protein [Pseudomonas aeruginosa]